MFNKQKELEFKVRVDSIVNWVEEAAKSGLQEYTLKCNSDSVCRISYNMHMTPYELADRLKARFPDCDVYLYPTKDNETIKISWA